MTPDPWATFEPPEWWTPPALSYADMDAICREYVAEQQANEYQADAIASAKSEEAFAANQQEYSK